MYDLRFTNLKTDHGEHGVTRSPEPAWRPALRSAALRLAELTMYHFRFAGPAVKAKRAEPGRFFESLQLPTFSVRWCPLGTVGSGALRLFGFAICDVRFTISGAAETEKVLALDTVRWRDILLDSVRIAPSTPGTK